MSNNKHLFSYAAFSGQHRFRGIATFLICSFSFLTGCEEPLNKYYPLPESQGGWRIDATERISRIKGFDPQKLKLWAYWNKVLPNGTAYQSAILIKDGWIINEAYSVYPKGQDRRYYLASNGKSFSLALLGKMFAESEKGDIDHTITPQSKLYDKRWLGEGFPLSAPLKTSITFEHLMRHVSGLQPEISRKYKNEKGRHKAKDFQDWVLGRDTKYPQIGEVFYPPGKPIIAELDPQWQGYSSVAFAHLGFVFKNIYQKPAHTVLEEKIFEPLGIESYQYYEAPDVEKDITWFTAGGLEMTMRDYARFAYLILNGGRWESKQIIPKQWVARLSQSALYPNWRSNQDGYFGTQYPKDMVRIFGAGANFAFIIPSLNMVAIHNGKHPRRIAKQIEDKFLRLLFDAYIGEKTWLE